MSDSTDQLTDAIVASIHASDEHTVPALRTVRRSASKQIRDLSPQEVIELAAGLLSAPGVPRWFAYELVHHHKGTMSEISKSDLERLGKGMDAWDEVDPFATYLSGVAWRKGQIDDDVIRGWATSDDRWWRRAALVSTIALNNRARGGTGDIERTLAACELLKSDHDDMVVKAMSWSLRELAKKFPNEVGSFIEANEEVLAARVLREVRNKLRTGLKNPNSSQRR